MTSHYPACFFSCRKQWSVYNLQHMVPYIHCCLIILCAIMHVKNSRCFWFHCTLNMWFAANHVSFRSAKQAMTYKLLSRALLHTLWGLLNMVYMYIRWLGTQKFGTGFQHGRLRYGTWCWKWKRFVFDDQKFGGHVVPQRHPTPSILGALQITKWLLFVWLLPSATEKINTSLRCGTIRDRLRQRLHFVFVHKLIACHGEFWENQQITIDWGQACWDLLYITSDISKHGIKLKIADFHWKLFRLSKWVSGCSKRQSSKAAGSEKAEAY